MKLEHTNIVAYGLGAKGVKIITSKNQGEFETTINQIDFTESDLFYGNSYLDMDNGFYPYSLNGAKLILRDTEELTKEEAVELGWIDEEHLKRGIENGRITVNDMKCLIDNEYDIFNLIDNGVAVARKH
jgi:hypothetical protein